MPLTHARTFRVRYYECDARGHVSSGSYLRYMQEAAFDASAAAGYDLARYDAMGRLWLVRETEIEHLAPLRYGDSVEVRTWVADFRRIRSRRAYELCDAGSGRSVARAQTDWVYLDQAAGMPASIGPGLVAAFHPEGKPPIAPPRSRFPAGPPPPGGAFHLRRRVDLRDLDQAGHVNNAVYLDYLDDCHARSLEAYGWPEERLWDHQLSLVARKHRIEYKQPALLNDDLEITTWASSANEEGMVRHYAVARGSDGALVAQARSLFQWMDPTRSRLETGPESFLGDLSPNIADALTGGRQSNTVNAEKRMGK